MYDTSTRSNIAAVRGALAAIGKTLPKPVLDALQEHDKIKAAAAEFTPATQDQIADAVAAALLADRDPTTDENVRRLLTANTLGANLAAGYGLNLEAPATGRVVTALTATADTIIATLIGPADEAGRDLTQASDLLGDQDDPAVIIRSGVAAVEAWTQAQKARKIIATIDAGWAALANLTGFASAGGTPTLRITGADLDVIDTAGKRADAWAVVRAGGVISLADRTTFAERTTRLAELVARRAGAPERADAGRRYPFWA